MGALDLALIAAYLVSVVAVGAALSRRQKTTRQYFTGGGRVPWWAVAASIVATETSAVTFLSIPGGCYARGGNFTFLQLALGYLLGRIAVSILFIPLYFRGELLTVYELLTARFGSGVKGLLAGLFVVMRTMADGIRLLLTAGVLAAVVRAFAPGADTDAAVLAACAALGFVMILFTLWGGMEAVIWIEVAQLGVYLLGAAAAAWVLASKIPGGFEAARALAAEHHKTQWIELRATFDKGAGYTLWAGLLGGAFLTMSTHGTDQYLVQRYLCVDRPAKAAAALLASGAFVFGQFVLFLWIGALLFAFYRPDQIPNYTALAPAAPFEKTDAVFTAFLTTELPPGVAGFVVAAILAAALSSSLNSIAATAVNDLVRPLARPRDDAAWLRLSKAFTVAAGVAQVGVAVAARHSRQSALENVLAVAGLANGPVLGVFLLGTFVPRAGRAAGLAGLAAGVAAALLVWQTSAFWAWYTAAGALSTLGAGALASLAFPAPKRTA